MSKKHSPSTTVIGIDIGGTGIKGGIVDLDSGEVLGDRYRIPTPSPSTPQEVAKVVKAIVDELMTRPHAPSKDAPVGITFPAIIPTAWHARRPMWTSPGLTPMWTTSSPKSWAATCRS